MSLFTPSRSLFVNDGCCPRLFVPFMGTKPRSHRAWGTSDLHSMDDKLHELHITIGRILQYEDVGLDVSFEDIQGEEILDDVNWKQEKTYVPLVRQFVYFHGESHVTLGTSKDTNREKHLGENVYVQHISLSFYRDAQKVLTATITVEESRSALNHASDALKLSLSFVIQVNLVLGRPQQYDARSTGTPSPITPCAIC